MKYLPLIIIAVVLSSCSIEESDLAKRNLNGPVKEIEEMCYEANSENGSITKGDDFFRYSYESDREDYKDYTLSAHLEFLSTDKTYEYEYKEGSSILMYNRDRNIQEEKYFFVFFLTGNVELSSQIVTQYNSEKKFETRIIYDGYGYDGAFVYVYDDNHLLVQVNVLDSREKLESKKVITYDSRGNINKVSQFDSDGEVENMVELKYNRKNDIIEYMLFDSYNGNYGRIAVDYVYRFGRVISKSLTYYYGDEIDIIEKYDYSLLGKTKKHVLLYEGQVFFQEEFDDNKIISAVESEDGEIISSWEMEYNENEDLVSEIERNSNGELVRTVKNNYDYDQHDNWIFKAHFVNDEAEYITERKISYYAKTKKIDKGLPGEWEVSAFMIDDEDQLDGDIYRIVFESDGYFKFYGDDDLNRGKWVSEGNIISLDFYDGDWFDDDEDINDADLKLDELSATIKGKLDDEFVYIELRKMVE